MHKIAENCVYQSPCNFQIFDDKTVQNELESRLDVLVIRERAADILLYKKTLTIINFAKTISLLAYSSTIKH